MYPSFEHEKQESIWKCPSCGTCSNCEKMINKQKQALRRPAVLEGISQNQTYKEIAFKLDVNEADIFRDISTMRFNKDPGLFNAQRMRQDIRKKKQELWSKTLEDKFTKMTGMTIQEKSFENMVDYYKPELLIILSSRDSATEIKKLPLTTRRALLKAGLLNSKHTEITQKALDHLLAQIIGIKTNVRT